MTSIIVTIVTHAYALVWLVPHCMILLMTVLVVCGEFRMLCTLICFLVACQISTFAPREGFSKWLHKIFLRSFNGVSIIRLDLPTTRDKPVMYCFHPHAMVANGFGLGMLSVLNTSGVPVTIAVARSLSWLNPVFKWLVNSHGIRMCTVSRRDLVREMSLGRCIGLCPGGFEEALLMQKSSDVVFLRKRTGFLHLASDFSYTIIQVFTFGETHIYENVLPLSRALKRRAARCGLPLVWPRGNSLLSFNPNVPPTGLRIVFGEPLEVPQVNTKTGIYDALHELYIQRLSLLHARFNPYHNCSLVIV